MQIDFQILVEGTWSKRFFSAFNSCHLCQEVIHHEFTYHRFFFLNFKEQLISTAHLDLASIQTPIIVITVTCKDVCISIIDSFIKEHVLFLSHTKSFMQNGFFFVWHTGWLEMLIYVLLSSSPFNLLLSSCFLFSPSHSTCSFILSLLLSPTVTFTPAFSAFLYFLTNPAISFTFFPSHCPVLLLDLLHPHPKSWSVLKPFVSTSLSFSLLLPWSFCVFFYFCSTCHISLQ